MIEVLEMLSMNIILPPLFQPPSAKGRNKESVYPVGLKLHASLPFLYSLLSGRGPLSSLGLQDQPSLDITHLLTGFRPLVKRLRLAILSLALMDVR
jgi:hypothetical protein